MLMRRAQKGFSLIESLFAVFLVAVAASIIVASLPLANSSRARADLLNRATNIAQKQLEAIKSQGYANINGTRLFEVGLLDSPTPDGSGRFSFTNTDNAFWDAPSQVLPSGRGFVTITQVRVDLIKVTVQVTWVDRGINKEVTLSTYLANF
ncbi:MAG: type II secretion system protein [Candidatus Caldarchaeum sp.]